MNSLRAPNPVDVAIGVVIAAAPYGAHWFLTATLPLWSVAGGLALGAAAFLALGALRRHGAARRGRERAAAERERVAAERHRELLGLLGRLADGAEKRRGAAGAAVEDGPGTTGEAAVGSGEQAASGRGRDARRGAGRR